MLKEINNQKNETNLTMGEVHPKLGLKNPDSLVYCFNGWELKMKEVLGLRHIRQKLVQYNLCGILSSSYQSNQISKEYGISWIVGENKNFLYLLEYQNLRRIISQPSHDQPQPLRPQKTSHQDS